MEKMDEILYTTISRASVQDLEKRVKHKKTFIGIYKNGVRWLCKYQHKTWVFSHPRYSKIQAALMYDMLKRMHSTKNVIQVNFPDYKMESFSPPLKLEIECMERKKLRNRTSRSHPYKTIFHVGSNRFKISRRYRWQGCVKTISITLRDVLSAIRCNQQWHAETGLPDKFLTKISTIPLKKMGIQEDDFIHIRNTVRDKF